MALRIRFSDTGYAVPSPLAKRLTRSSSTIHPTSRTGAERRSTAGSRSSRSAYAVSTRSTTSWLAASRASAAG